jgi:hypothetical protein
MDDMGGGTEVGENKNRLFDIAWNVSDRLKKGEIPMVKTKTLFIWMVLVLLGAAPAGLSAQSPEAGSPRYQHYGFAHRMVPNLVFSRQADVLSAFDNHGQEFVEALWEDAGKIAARNGQETIPKAGIEFSKEKANNMTLYLIKLPPPLAMTEAYFIAVVAKEGSVRYFTLEKTISLADKGKDDATVLGGWTKDRKHMNYGPGPKPEKEEFVKKLASMP